MSGRSTSACFGLQRDARSIFQDALRGCSVEEALTARLKTGDKDAFEKGTATLRLQGVRRLFIIAMGKGAATMLRALLKRSDIVDKRELAGVLVAPEPEQPEWLPASFEYIRGGHPVPDANSRQAAETILQRLREEPAGEDMLCLFLISGGSSAMVELPLDGKISVEDTAKFHRTLVHGSASIVDINTLRKHFSAVKGGRLAVAAGHLRQLSILMSDVPPGHLDALGSGPTLADGSTVADCRRILQQHALSDHLPEAVRSFFAGEALPETPKPLELTSHSFTLLSQADLAHAAADAARARGYYAVADDTPDDWSAEDAAQYLLERFRTLRQQHGRVCLVSTGEVTVALPKNKQGEAWGGRNQQFVLECAVQLAPHDKDFAVLSCGSDGVDGNSTAAGAVIASADFSSSEAQGRARETLALFQSNALLRRYGATIETGPTGLNLRDLRLLLG